MAQSRVIDFFDSKTKTFEGRQSAKRRKLDSTMITNDSTAKSTRSRSINNHKIIDLPNSNTFQFSVNSNTKTKEDNDNGSTTTVNNKANGVKDINSMLLSSRPRDSSPKSSSASLRSTRNSTSCNDPNDEKSKTKEVSSIRCNTRSSSCTSRSSRSKSNLTAKPRKSRTKGIQNDKSQRKLTDLIDTKLESSETKPSVSSNLECKSEKDVDLDLAYPAETSHLNLNDVKKEEPILEVTTSIIDNHDHVLSGLSTPRKRIMKMDSDVEMNKSNRVKKLAPRRLSADENVQGLNVAKDKQDESLSTTKPAMLDVVQGESDSIEASKDSDENVQTDVSPVNSKSDLLDLVSSMSDPPATLTPLQRTPERPLADTPLNESTPKLKSLSQKLNRLTNMNTEEKRALKNRLKQNLKLGDFNHNLKEKSKQLSAAIVVRKEDEKKMLDNTAREESSAITKEKDSSKELESQEMPNIPAHQKFEHLIIEGDPKLTLPFHYRQLETTFQAMDQIVSMLHNRSEICTFAKLKAAVQNVTRKNFEEKAVAQIKTITPDAYNLRREKNIPMYGKKTSEYQLTVEPRLLVKENSLKTKEGKPLFTASMLVSRKLEFKTKLINKVMQYHQTFLSTLSPPVEIKADAVKRWHGKFQLDKVPDVSPSELPSPPDVLVYNTAKDVLQKQSGKLNPWIEKALSNVAEANKLSEAASKTPPPKSPVPGASPAKKGIPQGLLDKIRAKEAAKVKDSLTRDPAEDNKTRMMGHLPEIIRILRSHFVTEKKPALPLDMVHKKLQESYRSGISMRDVELHINLLKELAPELVSEVEVKRGKFLKLDRNVDIQAINSRIMNQVKARK